MKTSGFTVQEFKEILLGQPFETVVEQYVFAGEPYVFREWPQGFEALRKHVCNALGLSNYQNVIVIGSAKLGFSLSPDSFGRQFSDNLTSMSWSLMRGSSIWCGKLCSDGTIHGDTTSLASIGDWPKIERKNSTGAGLGLTRFAFLDYHFRIL